MKMETPKMDVVRFQEADVLAASGDHIKTAGLYGWENGIDGDATLSFSNGQTTVHNWQELHAAANDDMYGTLSFYNASGAGVTLTQLASDENSYGAWNGTYERQADGSYRWKQ